MERIIIVSAVCSIQFLIYNFSNVGYVHSEESESFKCEGDGNYPHINDCKGYYTCKDGESTDNVCPENTSYEPSKQKCMNFYKWARCKRPDCSNESLRYVPHPGSNKVYVECFNKVPKSMTICPNDTEYSIRNTPPCDKSCEDYGFYPNEENPQVFFMCMEVGEHKKSVGFVCPEKYKLKKIKIGVMCVKKEKDIPSLLL
ncbi:unnamed protein product [Nezara viridula]|uniref:Chitin-binding type-2 domain-containing protein n=1 Tax=Nezara viridula TaxID=85310 RepID=A0A9P0HT98_NEZVI|nr:unnamed protein product [Nezara viridula]